MNGWPQQNRSANSPTICILGGLFVTLVAVAIYSGYTATQLRGLRRLQIETIDRNRMDSLLLLRIQNTLNSLALAMRDMLDANEPYPLTAWRAQFRRIRTDLEDALAREQQFSSSARTADQRRYIRSSMHQFWDALDRIFELADRGNAAQARLEVRLSLQARQAAISTAVARFLVQNNEAEEELATHTRAIYRRVEDNVYLFVAAMLVLIAITSVYVVQYNRRIFHQVEGLSKRRSELAQQLISMQENLFGSISRELHDDFGQILTAIGAMLRRAGRHAPSTELREVQEIVQEVLEKVRTLSQALHPVVLDESDFESALEFYLGVFQKQTGIGVEFKKDGETRDIARDISIHLYRVVQEALSNVARHSKANRAEVRLLFQPASVTVEVEDAGIGFVKRTNSRGMGLVSMRERAELVNGIIQFLDAKNGGAIVRFTVPLNSGETHAAA
jgi:signal transduction histidine kinase